MFSFYMVNLAANVVTHYLYYVKWRYRVSVQMKNKMLWSQATTPAPGNSDSWAYYVVRWGEKLTGIALRYRRTAHRLVTL
jgi:hypothetical protein